MFDMNRLTAEQLQATAELMSILGDTCILFAMEKTSSGANQSSTGAAMIGGTALLSVDLITTGPFCDAHKDQIFHATLEVMKERYRKNMESMNDRRSKENVESHTQAQSAIYTGQTDRNTEN